MSSDRSALALERLDVAADVGAPPAAAPAGDLAALAAALAQAEALVSAGADGTPDAAAALERIADIAFVLHEREVEPSLCDALDSAMREIGEANARNRANVQRAREAAELLRGLARRVDAMMAAQTQPLAAVSDADALECADEFPAPARLFDADVAEDSAFAQTIAALAQALPARSDAPARFQDHAADGGAAPDAAADSFDVEPEQAEAFPSAWLQTENSSSGAEERTPQGTAVPPPETAAVASVASTGAAATLPVETHRAIDPDEDPGDLFEPVPDTRLAIAAIAPQESLPPATSIAPQSAAAPTSAPASVASRSAANDPLAPIRALSEEELIALFS